MNELNFVCGMFGIGNRRYSFNGYFELDEGNNLIDSLLVDKFGNSKVENFIMDGSALDFRKIYDRNNEYDNDQAFDYSFKKVKGLWVGDYKAIDRNLNGESKLSLWQIDTDVSKKVIESIIKCDSVF